MGNIHVKLYKIQTSGSGGDVYGRRTCRLSHDIHDMHDIHVISSLFIMITKMRVSNNSFELNHHKI